MALVPHPVTTNKPVVTTPEQVFGLSGLCGTDTGLLRYLGRVKYAPAVHIQHHPDNVVVLRQPN